VVRGSAHDLDLRNELQLFVTDEGSECCIDISRLAIVASLSGICVGLDVLHLTTG
jgi:uncharacterized protein YqkB